MAIKLFGYTIAKEEEPIDLKNQNFATPLPDDGATQINTTGFHAGGYFGTYLEMDATAKSESELITRYREASYYPDCSTAIDEITTEAIAALDDEVPVQIHLDEAEIPEKIKASITEEFNHILQVLQFNDKGHDLFRRWYVDGRLYMQKIIDMKNPKRGIMDVIQIDPRKIRKVREIKKDKDQKSGIDIVTKIEEYFIYNDKGINYSPNYSFSSTASQGVKILPDTIAFVPSGLMDLEKNVVLGHLHKAIKPVNQLKMMEDALVIYRLARAPERRIFYIDVGNLPKVKAEQYLKDIMARYRNKIVYDSNNGEIRDDKKFMSLLEDFWLPRREGGKGTEITTLPGGENLGQIEDINYFQTKLYQALNVPLSRMQAQSGISFGRATEITRDELKFAKFVGRLRKKFNALFADLLRTQLLLKGIVTETDWDTLKEKIQYKYAQDQYFEEMKSAENLRNRIDLLNQMQPYVGIYFSQKYIQKDVLRFTDADIIMMQKQIKQEPAPSVMMPPEEQGQNPAPKKG